MCITLYYQMDVMNCITHVDRFDNQKLFGLNEFTAKAGGRTDRYDKPVTVASAHQAMFSFPW